MIPISLDGLLPAILKHYTLSVHGIHGLAHWGRVLENGLQLAALEGARVEVVTLFALFHDSQRIHDGGDFDHGRRGAALAAKLRGRHFELSGNDFELLDVACTLHTRGLTDADPTVQVCWDADRLDLGRVGITPDPRLLCTDAARDWEMIRWANDRAMDEVVPEFIQPFLERASKRGDNRRAWRR